ncbi:MAG: TonB-dependent receptor [Pedosphaera sp.]|nr:TonB-dependent receptor [Pedosphaera sp.]
MVGGGIAAEQDVVEKLRLTLGAEYRDDFRQERKAFSEDKPDIIIGENHRTAQNHGVFLNGEYTIRTNLHLNAGARYDQYQDVDPTANPRVALIYNPVPAGTLKAIYGTAFRAPNFFERNLESHARALVLQTITTYELLYQQDIRRHFRATLDGYYNETDDLISLQPDPAGYS